MDTIAIGSYMTHYLYYMTHKSAPRIHKRVFLLDLLLLYLRGLL